MIFSAGLAVPRRDAMSPPQLARDAPVVNVAHPLEVGFGVVLGNELDVAVLDHFDRAIRQRLNLHEPLRRQARLDDGLAAAAFAQRHNVILRADQEAAALQILQNFLPRLEAVQPLVWAGVLVHLRDFVHHLDLRQVVAQPGLEVVGIMRRRDLHRAGAELGIGQDVVGDDRDLAVHQRQQYVLAMQMPIALVAGVHGNRGIAQHRLGTRGGDDDVLARRADDGIANLVELARRLLVHHFQIGDRGDAARTPVDDVLAAIDQPFFVEADESFAHRARHALVHGEVLARPVDGGAQPLHLLKNDAAVVLLPVPHAGDECLATDIAAVLAFGGQLALHHQLGGDAGMVGARKPQRPQPRMRFQRTMMSISVCSSMWPMWRLPVTLGGGRVTVKVCLTRAVGGGCPRGIVFP